VTQLPREFGAERAPAQVGPDVLRITEIFLSLQGETSSVGWPTVFVRLTGCPLRCQYCDTAYAFSGGSLLHIEAVLDDVARHRARFVTVTGGEPLAQPGCLPLLVALCDRGYRVSLETSGALDIAAVDPRVVRIVDLKTPASGECHRNRYENLADLRAHDEVKFVICDEADYQWARLQADSHRLYERVANVLFSPVQGIGALEPRLLAEWMLRDGVPARFQIQLHKFLWGDAPGH
jgi:7-carboxy-7-deazaguanine synthase